MFDRNKIPAHLLNSAELDFSGDLFADPQEGSWFRLGAWTHNGKRDKRGLLEAVERRSFLIEPSDFPKLFPGLHAIGNVIGNMGSAGGSVWSGLDGTTYRYSPFHKFEFSFSPVVAEPLVFARPDAEESVLFINPDLWLFFGMEEKAPGVWWHKRRGVEALRHYRIDDNDLEVVEIQTRYLLNYLQGRQLSLIVGHYRGLQLFSPSPETVQHFVGGDNVVLGSPQQGAKAIFENWGPQKGPLDDEPYLFRRLHLWFQITPPVINPNNPWLESPDFDLHAFTLPTRSGAVAPAWWREFQDREAKAFAGKRCDFMDPIYFRQEVLSKYEGAAGFSVEDNGSVSYQQYWGLTRSTSRLGNELLATSIGDFAEAVPFEEWPHWKQYAVEPPSQETMASLRQQETVPSAVNSVTRALTDLNMLSSAFAAAIGTSDPQPLWNGSSDSLAGRQLKWVYAESADDDEFLKRMTLLSTYVLDELKAPALRTILDAFDKSLSKIDGRPLGSRRLLERLTLVAILIEEIKVDAKGLVPLVQQTEGRQRVDQPDLQAELDALNRRARTEFAPLAFLYDLRTFGGVAHPPNPPDAAEAAVKLGLAAKNWRRDDYLRVLKSVAGSISQATEHLSGATRALGA